MATAFPALCPTRRDFTPGDYPVKRFTAINGAGTTRIYGDSAFDAQLRLEFWLMMMAWLQYWNVGMMPKVSLIK